MKKLSRTLLMMLVITMCTGLTSCDALFGSSDNSTPTPTPTPEPTSTSTTIELTTAELTPEQMAQTEAQLIAAQQKGATIGITFSYKGIDYDASFEKTEGEDYKLVAFTSSQTSTIEETLKLANFTPYLTTLVPDNWTEEQIDEYYANLIDDEGDDDEGDEGDVDDNDDDEGDDDEGDDDDSEYSDELTFTDFDSEDEEPAGTRAMTRATTSTALDMLFGLRTATDEDLVQVQINTAGATATIVGETDLFALKSVSTSGATYATARTRAENYKTEITVKINKNGDKKVSKVYLAPTELKIKSATTKIIKVTIKPKDANITKIVWKSYNKSVAKIAKNGKRKYSIKVKPQFSGETHLSVKVYSGSDRKDTRTGKITVSIAVTFVKLNGTQLELTPSQTYQLTATVNPKNNVDQTVTWSSSDDKIAKVDDNGKVTAVAFGTATITATSKENTDMKATCTVTVIPQDGVDDPDDYDAGGTLF